MKTLNDNHKLVKEPRRQHYNTRCYLINFCKLNSTGTPVFWVFDIIQQKWNRLSQPKNESVEGDFQKMDHLIGLDPYFLEKYFGPIEENASKIINKIFLERKLSRNLRQSHELINLIGLLAGRTQATKKRLIEAKKETAIKFLDDSVKTENTYSNIMNYMKKKE